MTETEAEAYVRYSAELDLAWQKRLLAVEADMERIAADRDRWCDLAASRAKQNAELQRENAEHAEMVGLLGEIHNATADWHDRCDALLARLEGAKP